MLKSLVIGEKYPSKVGAVFDTAEQAEELAADLTRQIGVQSEQLVILQPSDPDFECKLEPETRGIRETLLRSHISLAGLGLAVGFLICWVLYFLDVAMVSQNPYYAYSIILAFSVVAGLLLGGLVSLRPDHDPLIQFARNNGQQGSFVLLVHLSNSRQKELVKSYLDEHSKSVIATL